MRRQALERDNYRCQHCGKAAGRFEVDHILPIAKGGDPYELANTQTLCRPCHFRKSVLDRGGVPHVADAAWERLKAEMM